MIRSLVVSLAWITALAGQDLRIQASPAELIPGQTCRLTLLPDPAAGAIPAWTWRTLEAEEGGKAPGAFTRVRSGPRQIFRAGSVDRPTRVRIEARPQDGEAWVSVEVCVRPGRIRIEAAPGVDLQGLPSGGRCELRATDPESGPDAAPLAWSVAECQGGAFLAPPVGNTVVYQAPDVLEPTCFHLWTVRPGTQASGCLPVRVLPSHWEDPAARQVFEGRLMSLVQGPEWAAPSLECLARFPEEHTFRTMAALPPAPGETDPGAILVADREAGLCLVEPPGTLRPLALHGRLEASMPETSAAAFPKVDCLSLAAGLPGGRFAAVLETWNLRRNDGRPLSLWAPGPIFLCAVSLDGRVSPLGGSSAPGAESGGPWVPANLLGIHRGLCVGPGGEVHLGFNDPLRGASGIRTFTGSESGITQRVRAASVHLDPRKPGSLASRARSLRSLTVDPDSGRLTCLDDQGEQTLLRRLDPDGRITVLARDEGDGRFPRSRPVPGPAWRPLAETGGLACARDLVHHQGFLCWTDLLTGSLQAFDPASGLVRMVMPSGLLRPDLPLPCAAPDLLPEECACAGAIRLLCTAGPHLLLFDGRAITRLSLPRAAAPRDASLP
jgi:hypothetical protein